MRTATTVVLAAVLIAVGLAACGGGEDSTGTTVPDANAGATAPDSNADSAATPTDSGSSTNASKTGGSNLAGKGTESDGGSHGGSSNRNLPPRSVVPSGGVPTPGFHDTSGKTDIPAFGVEAGADTREDVQGILRAYFRASEQGEWSKACAWLSPETRTQILEFVTRPDQPKDCGEALPVFVEGFSRDGQPTYDSSVRVAGLRAEDKGGAFALFHGADGVDYWMSMRLEGGEWKILSVVPQPLR